LNSITEDLSIHDCAKIYNDWRLFGVCSWCGDGGGDGKCGGVYYRDFGVYLPFPHLLIALNPVEIQKLCDEREFGEHTNDGFGICLPLEPIIDVRSGKILWCNMCQELKDLKFNHAQKSFNSKQIRTIQNVGLIDNMLAVEHIALPNSVKL
jgi:hypothetical protein